MAKDPDTTNDITDGTANPGAASPSDDQSDHRGDGETAMDDDERLEQLAAQFLALWREQVSATADGSQAASAIGRLYASLGADTTRMGEGFEAWGNLIGQMAMGQHPVTGAANPLGAVSGTANPLQAMMDQMTKAARDLPTRPFPGGMPFPPNMAAMANMTGTPQSGQTNPGKSATTADGDTSADADVKSAAKGAKKASKNTCAVKDAAKGQGNNDQSAKTKAASAKKGKPKAGGAKAASDAHGSRDDELAQLARRIADLSETIAALEAGTEGSGGETSD